MEISKRIYAIAECIKYDTLADIGTDHCYIPIAALNLGKIHRAIGVDVNKGPLAIGLENLKAVGYEEQIELRLGSGLRPIKQGEAESVTIAGMGGILICNILEDSAPVVKTIKQLLISPQSDLDLVRKTIHKLYLKITKEIMMKDAGKFYHIIECENGKEVAYNEQQYFLSKKLMEEKSAIFAEYVKKEIHKTESILKHIKGGADSTQNREKIQTLSRNLAHLKGTWGDNYEMF